MEENLKKNKRKILYFSIYRALAYDWFFIYAVDSVYYNEVKLMSFSQISLLFTVASLTYIIFCIPMIRVVRKIGTATSSRIGTILYLFAAVLLIFSPWTIFLSQVVYMIGKSLNNSSETKLLKDNLKIYGMSKDYSKYSSITQFLWALINTISTLCAGFMYELWVYAPVVANCIIMFIALVMSIFIKNEKEIYKKQNNLPAHTVKLEKFEFFKLFKYKTTWLLLLFSTLIYGFIGGLMDVNKMPFQELQISALTISIVFTITYFIRALASFGFGFLYRKLRFKSIYIIITLAVIGVIMIGTGGMLLSGTTALIILSIGTVLLYSSRDPFNLVREDFVMNSNGLTKRQTLLQVTFVGNYTGRMLVSLLMSYLLLSQTVAEAFLIMLFMVPLIILVTVLLQRKRKINKYDQYY